MAQSQTAQRQRLSRLRDNSQHNRQEIIAALDPLSRTKCDSQLDDAKTRDVVLLYLKVPIVSSAKILRLKPAGLADSAATFTIQAN